MWCMEADAQTSSGVPSSATPSRRGRPDHAHAVGRTDCRPPSPADGAGGRLTGRQPSTPPRESARAGRGCAGPAAQIHDAAGAGADGQPGGEGRDVFGEHFRVQVEDLRLVACLVLVLVLVLVNMLPALGALCAGRGGSCGRSSAGPPRVTWRVAECARRWPAGLRNTQTVTVTGGSLSLRPRHAGGRGGRRGRRCRGSRTVRPRRRWRAGASWGTSRRLVDLIRKRRLPRSRLAVPERTTSQSAARVGPHARGVVGRRVGHALAYDGHAGFCLDGPAHQPVGRVDHRVGDDVVRGGLDQLVEGGVQGAGEGGRAGPVPGGAGRSRCG